MNEKKSIIFSYYKKDEFIKTCKNFDHWLEMKIKSMEKKSYILLF